MAGGAAPASDWRVRATAWAGPDDGCVEEPGVGHCGSRAVRGLPGIGRGAVGRKECGRSPGSDGE